MQSPRWPLARQIAMLAGLNLILLTGILFFFALFQFGASPGNWILGPAREHLLAIGQSFSLELPTTDSIATLLDRYAVTYNARFFLVDPEGSSFTDASVDIPRELRQRMMPKGPLRPKPPGRRPPPNDSIFFVSTPIGYWVGIRMPIPIKGSSEPMPGMLLIQATSIFNANLFFDFRVWLALLAALLLASLLCWLPFVRSLTKTIAALSSTTESIATGNFDARLVIDRHDELGLLGTRIQQMSARIAGFVRGQKRFLGDIAHELSAPIARLQFAIGILENNSTEQQQRHIATLREELQDMSSLVAELLSFSKAGLNPEDIAIGEVCLDEVVDRVATREGSDAFEIHIPNALKVMANENYLQRALSNLLRNAIRYAGADGPIVITADAGRQWVTLSIADSGPGLPDAELDRVFAPFYRPEESRTRETGGVGLGLAIVKSCIEACRGTIECRNRKPHGLELVIRLPAAQQ